MINLTNARVPSNGPPKDPVDIREQLFINGITGLAQQIQVPSEWINRLLGITRNLDLAKPDEGIPFFPRWTTLAGPSTTSGPSFDNPRRHATTKSGSAVPACISSCG